MMRLKQRKGEGAILSCVLLLVMAMVFSAVSEYASAALTLATVRRQARETLDSYIWEESIVSFQELKRDSGSGALFLEGYVQRLLEERGLVRDEKGLSCLTASGRRTYTLSDPELNVLSDWHYTVSFTLTLPLRIQTEEEI